MHRVVISLMGDVVVTADADDPQPIYIAPNTDPDGDGPLDANSPAADEAHPAKLVVNQDITVPVIVASGCV